ncbi:MAG: ribonuclease III [Lachnospiraceae bacterium]|nr:ribonuclease III [Lachnospiraceae bacterium]
MGRDYSKFEEKIGYTFSNKKLLEQAFSHSSYINERKVNHEDSYERMEFLGDAVLELVVSQYLFDHYKEKTEGELTKLRASLVCEATLSQCARTMGISDYLLLSKGEELTGGRQRDSILCDVFEAVLGAIYLDSGLSAARNHVEQFLMTDIEEKQLFYDAKTILQEKMQKDGNKVTYELVEERGPQHSKEFVVHAVIDGIVVGKGIGKTKKAAEQMAAYKTLIASKDEK